MKRKPALPFKAETTKVVSLIAHSIDQLKTSANIGGDLPEAGICDTSGFYYGTLETTEPMVCARLVFGSE